MDFLHTVLDLFLHLDQHLNEWAGALGPWLYAGALPDRLLRDRPGGDALPAGRLAALRGRRARLDRGLAALAAADRRRCCVTAAVLGDAVNYAIGHYLGPMVFTSERSRLLNREAPRAHARVLRATRRQDDLPRALRADRAHLRALRRRHRPHELPRASRSTTSRARSPGCSRFLLAGYCFGQIPTVKRNFHIVILAIIVISLLPVVIEYLRARRAPARVSPIPASRREAAGGGLRRMARRSFFRERVPDVEFLPSREQTTCGPAALYFAVAHHPAASRGPACILDRG